MCQHHHHNPLAHPWERLGLGAAPFKCEQVKSTGSHPIATGECAVCGTKLTYNYIIVSHDGRTFPVGCECVLVLDHADVSLVTQVREMDAAHKKELREARTAKKVAAALETFKTKHAAVFDFLDRHHTTDPVLAKIHAALLKTGGLTATQLATAVRAKRMAEGTPGIAFSARPVAAY